MGSNQREVWLETALNSPDPVERDRAGYELAQCLNPSLVLQCIACLGASRDLTRRRALRLLSQFPSAHIIEPLTDTLTDKAQAIKIRVASARLLTMASRQKVDGFTMAFADPDPRIRRASVTTAMPDQTLRDALFDSDDEVAARAAQIMLRFNIEVDAQAVDQAVRQRTNPPDPLVRLLAKIRPDSQALISLGQNGHQAALDYCTDTSVFESMVGDAPVRAAWGLGRLNTVPQEVCDHVNPRVRAAAARHLSATDPNLGRLSQDPDPVVAWYARQNRRGTYAHSKLQARLTHSASVHSPSADPPYGLRSGDNLPVVQRADAALAMCQARFNMNLGVAMRSAEAAGFKEIFFVGRAEYLRSPARGADLAIQVHQVPDSAGLIRIARERGYQIVAIQQTAASVPYHVADYPPKPLFVLGSEDAGMPDRLREAADLAVEIPQFGIIDSLNVATAATVVMFHWRVHRGTQTD
jgi:tRNA G18 (ribose-2'-O)-methylase SpoU